MKTEFPSIPKIVPAQVRGEAKVEHFEVDKHDSRMTALRPREYVPEGKYARLYVNGVLMMSDTRMEQRTNYDVVWKANGKVLIAGLGLGMILPPILKKPDVKSVLVLEKSQDVIDLVAPYFQHKKLQVVCANVFTWQRPKEMKFDTIYFDIWPNICVDNLEEIAKLHQKYKYALNRDGDSCWMGSWCQEQLKAQRQQDKRRWPW